jgi:hypothetical protein
MGEENKKLTNPASRVAMRYYTTLVMTLSCASSIYHRSDSKLIKWQDFLDVKVKKIIQGKRS